jgi:hypothetical protein
MTQPTELIAGTCERLLFSPKGGIEGALVKVKGVTVQVTVDAAIGTALWHGKGPGSRVRVLADADRSPKAKAATHAVYRFKSFANAEGLAVAQGAPTHTTVKGLVTALHYARHGEPNGVILDGGEFVHLRPKGMVQLGLEVGSRVTAVGEASDTVLGTRMLEAHRVNRVDLAA